MSTSSSVTNVSVLGEPTHDPMNDHSDATSDALRAGLPPRTTISTTTLQDKQALTEASEKPLESPSIASQLPIENKQPEPLPPPDGGLDAWLTVMGSCLVAFCTFGIVGSFGAFSDFYHTTFLTNYSPTVVTMIGAMQVFVLYMHGSFVGPIFDAYGPRYMIPGSGIVASFALFMLSITKSQQIWQQYLTQAILFPVGAGFGFFPAVAVVAHWFRKRAAYALGCVVGGAAAGNIVFPILLHKLIPKIGFGWSVRIVAFIVIACYVVASVTIKVRRPPKPLPPLTKMFDYQAFADIRFLLFAIGGWFFVFSAFNPFFYVGQYGIVVNGSNSVTPYLLAIMSAASLVGRVLPGFIADKVGRFNTICATSTASGILCLAMWYTSTAPGAVAAFAALYGFFSGPFFSLLPACIAQITPIEKIGARIGIMFAFLSTGTLSGSPIGGVFIKLETKAHFDNLILYTGVMALAGAAFLIAARFACDRRLLAAI
ncbi:hypothetical protein JAAARDRAFT_706557 [Jaapia argillacea MUCL 33604]|uniref:Major facilitator superfamily (MFS) profile domain-containing protein n=1 Tax=Jaapia argillacea MUCL 33604 TaxID=933084 RepID=A0A067PJT6_9AGAM|nr:hypothetical protein JAAARDRAFT_706557 [Jaapia argillacea MUCL 33604]